MEIVPLEAGTRAAERVAKKFEAIFGLARGLSMEPDDVLYRDVHSIASSWATCVSDRLDELLVKARQVYDRAERKALYAEIQALTLDESTHVFLIDTPMTTAMNQKVMGFTPNIGLWYLQLDWIWLKK